MSIDRKVEIEQRSVNVNILEITSILSLTDVLSYYFLKLFFLYCLCLQDDLGASSASHCITSSQYSNKHAHDSQLSPVYGRAHNGCAPVWLCSKYSKCHQFLIYKQVMYQECDSWEKCLAWSPSNVEEESTFTLKK